MWKKIKKYYSPVLDVLTFLILILTILYVVYHYRYLPAEIPRHFNFAGEPDAWSSKTMIIGLGVLYIFIIVQCFILNYFLIMRPKNPQNVLHVINLPFMKKDELSNHQAMDIRTHTARMIAVLNLLVSILFSAIHYGMIQTAYANQEGLGIVVPIITVILLLLPILYIWRIYREIKH
ncbi:Protein of unknown function [Alteribacillus persepolensis]|uniref:DUF1648 domain-containing protein n=1 Tax=Alteribacillus persepolensis TaxID=568899 RepID=A0A1G8EX19_9BACI|nr:DUF1648 domain-containing protein [Alteribacillus persepolensis]SDH74400.1 Protein of unknown function [Alteribacillus persepolensis]